MSRCLPLKHSSTTTSRTCTLSNPSDSTRTPFWCSLRRLNWQQSAIQGRQVWLWTAHLRIGMSWQNRIGAVKESPPSQWVARRANWGHRWLNGCRSDSSRARPYSLKCNGRRCLTVSRAQSRHSVWKLLLGQAQAIASIRLRLPRLLGYLLENLVRVGRSQSLDQDL